MHENPCPLEIHEDQQNLDQPLWWKTVNFLENFSDLKFETLLQEQECINDTVAVLDKAPQMAEDDGAKELASKQHSMWITKLLDNTWPDAVIVEMNAFND